MAEAIQGIMFHLTTRDVLRCMRVCKYWKNILSDEYFWKKFVNHSFDLRLQSEIDGQLYQWSDRDVWACYFDDDDGNDLEEEDIYVMHPFPSKWQSGVVVPFGLQPMLLDSRLLQGLCHSLEILVHMAKGIREFHLHCGNECSGNEGANAIDVVLFPWHGDELPDGNAVLRDMFHFHDKICENTIISKDICKQKMYFHMTRESHRVKDNPCLNQVFGRSYSWEEDANYDYQKELAFFTWLQGIMVPSRIIYAGEGRFNPIAEFFITNLAPGWVGGVLTGQVWT